MVAWLFSLGDQPSVVTGTGTPTIHSAPSTKHAMTSPVRHPRRTKLTFRFFLSYSVDVTNNPPKGDNLSSSVALSHHQSTNQACRAIRQTLQPPDAGIQASPQPSLSSPLPGWLPPSITHRLTNRPTKALPGSVSDRHQPASPRHPNQPPGSQGGGGGRPIGNQPWTDRQVSNLFFFPRRE